jgi:imidazolonepropionase-like amidohydrolase
VSFAAILLVAAVPFACTRGASTTSRPPSDMLALTHVTVVDVGAPDAARAAQVDRTVLIDGGRITVVGPAALVAVPAGARVVDGRGKYLIPGLWDAHAHVTNGGEPALAAYVANGVTTVRDLGGRLPELLAWRGAIRAGTRTGPRLLLAGPNIEGAWWLDVVTGFMDADPALRSYGFTSKSPRYRLASAADAPAAVDSLLRMGVDLIKFRNLRADEFRALAAEARRRGVTLVGHAPGRVPIGEAAEAGLRSFEHSETVMLRLDGTLGGDTTEAARRAELARVARAGTAITPTLVTDVAYRQTPDSVARAAIADVDARRDPRRRYVSRELLAQWQFGLDTKRVEGPTVPETWRRSHVRQVADTRRARDAGVPLLVGTDLGVALVYPGFGVHDEMALLVDEAGLTPLEALRAATLAPAQTMRMADSLGRVARGQLADLVLLDADPLRDVGNVRRIHAVVIGGRLLERVELDRLLEEGARLARATYR